MKITNFQPKNTKIPNNLVDSTKASYYNKFCNRERRTPLKKIIIQKRQGEWMHSLEELRKSAGLSQLELSKLFDVSDRTIFRYEQDSTNISNDLLNKYMKAFNINYDDIFLGKKYDFYVLKQKIISSNLMDKAK